MNIMIQLCLAVSITLTKGKVYRKTAIILCIYQHDFWSDNSSSNNRQARSYLKEL